MSLPEIVSRQEWETARQELLAREKELTHARDALAAARRRLPMVRVEKDYRFQGPDGEVGLIDLFEHRHQLIVCHFMFDPEWEDGCSSCTAGADEMAEGKIAHLHARDTTLAYVSRAPYGKIARYKAKRGWTFPWYSSHGSDFNYDFHVTLDGAVTPVQYNFRTPEQFAAAGHEFELAGEYPGRSSFLRDGDRVFHTYSVYARGLESIGGSYYLLEETALGRQEGWEQPAGRADAVRDATPDFAA
ncbi:MAG TPA: DUF899 domain-containing protein [Solirubrobacteraceae bacterium]|jgi:predicted dithiol-disulfide oxidoreductase (DUF899 family)|nr:DUF899 domain-containing protein [Solirubrobacteraceae bacterium]